MLYFPSSTHIKLNSMSSKSPTDDIAPHAPVRHGHAQSHGTPAQAAPRPSPLNLDGTGTYDFSLPEREDANAYFGTFDGPNHDIIRSWLSDHFVDVMDILRLLSEVTTRIEALPAKLRSMRVAGQWSPGVADSSEVGRGEAWQPSSSQQGASGSVAPELETLLSGEIEKPGSKGPIRGPLKHRHCRRCQSGATPKARKSRKASPPRNCKMWIPHADKLIRDELEKLEELEEEISINIEEWERCKVSFDRLSLVNRMNESNNLMLVCHGTTVLI